MSTRSEPAGARSADRRRAGLLAATEPVRAAASAGALALTYPLLRGAPRGEPHAVLVLPGLLASDASTVTLRRWVRGLGYPVVGWELGRNRGPTKEITEALPKLVTRLAEQHGGPVSVVGQSLGGIYARRLALRVPRLVRQVVSLGSPFGLAGRPADGTPGARAYDRYRHLHSVSGRPRGGLGGSLPVPSTAVYSPWDGVVDWRACRQEPGPRAENVGVHASHLGMGHDPAVLWLVADRLAQTREDWRPFTPPARLRLLYTRDDED
ncbi:pimeloyl-ACP methyl ester carboxylesterase [Geodermatophilus bullaregiensis]|uniref:esterase/lipase family protein n=1 Tax=Geodermatophilus bullaregiensis TaxID=1564160 RepID=UPI001958C824|nr:alpha/beta hydrolase [Geodermatophilus bullaregiensis]MBM7805142.1 pimeloyl-ACP methyl ester carboxylesterase [Geodermatophilus bullaregiensis]